MPAVGQFRGSLMDLLSLTRDEIRAELEKLGEPGFRAAQICAWIYARRATAFAAMTDLPGSLRARLEECFDFGPLEVVRDLRSPDSTRKFLFRLADGQMIESVSIPASPGLYGQRADRRTICVSSQVGCAYGCRFCASGLDGWKRNLTAAEIVAQFLAVEALTGERIDNAVFMGMGEPFANYASLMRAIGILNAPWGLALGARHMTVSTSGLAPRIREFADQPLQVRLAVSLHGATDNIREQIMPVNRKHPLGELLEACAYYTARKKQRLTFEYILIRGVNDSDAQAAALARHAVRLKAKVNLIPYNTVEGLPWQQPESAVQERFAARLRGQGVAVTLRKEKGPDIAAACGQLRLQVGREKPVAPPGGLR